jgi:hypothetical protein
MSDHILEAKVHWQIPTALEFCVRRVCTQCLQLALCRAQPFDRSNESPGALVVGMKELWNSRCKDDRYTRLAEPICMSDGSVLLRRSLHVVGTYLNSLSDCWKDGVCQEVEALTPKRPLHQLQYYATIIANE